MVKNKVLYILEQNKGTVVSGGQLACQLKVSRNAIWKSIRSLQAEGNLIVSIPNKGYMLKDENDSLLETTILDKLNTSFVGKRIKLLSSTTSTIQYLKEMDTTNSENGFVVIADEQTKGRGRRGREFLSPKGEGVYFSILLKVDRNAQDIRLLTICAAVAVSKALENLLDIRAEIKWVNDIYLGGKKVCGILTEAVLSGELQELDTVIVGIGLNTGKVPESLQDIATSIKDSTGVCGIRNDLVAEILNQFEETYLSYTSRKMKESILAYYESRLFIIGQRIEVENLGRNFSATVLGIDDAGGLIVQDENNVVSCIISGEIKLSSRKK